ncbi:MAG TPA: helix-hairpin-helix domain-containing protein [Thermodesulfobacteriota bacterium]|nr:helix-hairpin-helix domain-containing protein [Thermodesulfobacteriota bacterium]
MKKNLLFLVCNRPLLSLALLCLLVFGLRSSCLIDNRNSLYDPQTINHGKRAYIEFAKNDEFPVIVELDDVFPPSLLGGLGNGDKIVLEDNGTLTVSRMDGRKSLALGIRIGINSASHEGLVMLPGIGNTLAHRIVEYRELNKGYKSVNELIKVKGIGVKKLEAIKMFVSLD